MPMTCTVCRNPKREDADRALLEGRPLRAIALQVGCTKDALYRHSKSHLLDRLVQAKAVRDGVEADALGDNLVALTLEAKRLGRKAERSGDLRAAMQAIRELVRIQEVTAKISGAMNGPAGRSGLPLHLLPETLARMAQVFLLRRGRPSEGSTIEARAVEVPEP